MISIERYFDNIFTPKEITPQRLETFASEHLARLKENNPAGVYDSIIALTETAVLNFKTGIAATGSGKGLRKGSVMSKTQQRKNFINYLAQKEGLIKAVFGKKSPTYKEFFPRGINAFRHATDEGFRELADVMVKTATRYVAELGATFLAELTDRRNAFETAYLQRQQSTGSISRGQHDELDAKTTLQLQLVVNICTIAARNPGKPEAADLYFSQHLLFPAKKHRLHKGMIEAGETKPVCTFKYSEGKRFHIMINGVEPVQFQMMLRGNGVGRLVTVKPGEKFNEPFGYFSSAGDTLLAMNPSDKRARYMVWEIA